MGLSSSKTTSGPSKAALPYINHATSTLTNAVNANQSNVDAISGKIRGLFDSYAGGDDATLGAARGYVGDVLGGKYLSGNPQLEAIIGQTNNDVTDRVNAIFSRAGQVGSSRYGGELGKQLSAAENNLRYQNYGDEMSRMASAAGLAPGLSSAEAQRLAAMASLGQTAADLPLTNAQALAQGIGGLWGNSTTTKQSGNVLGQLLQAGAQAGSAAILASDPNLKTGVTLIRRLADGLGVYRFLYREAPNPEIGAHMPLGPRVGVMADEVARLRPWALGPRIGGFATVNMGAL